MKNVPHRPATTKLAKGLAAELWKPQSGFAEATIRGCSNHDCTHQATEQDWQSAGAQGPPTALLSLPGLTQPLKALPVLDPSQWDSISSDKILAHVILLGVCFLGTLCQT